MATIKAFLLLPALGLVLPAGRAASDQLDVQTILERSVEANERDWEAAPQYDYSERDRAVRGTRTYDELMILGSPYERLIAVNGAALSLEEQAAEQAKLDAVVAARQAESEQQRAERVADYERERKRDLVFLDQLALAFEFTLVSEDELDGREVYVLKARPRADYQPPNVEAKVLTGMQGKLWIDKSTFQWVKVEARVIHPVEIGGFLARVEPGTQFELEKMSIEDGIWLPKHFAMKSRAKILFLFSQRKVKDETYFNYRAATAAQPQ
jgi:hypothetical protein